MSYSSLVTYQKTSPNKNERKDAQYNPSGAITGIAIHHVAGVTTVESLGALFAQSSRQASSNYGIGNDGRIGCYAEEEYRSWCTGNRQVDYNCITIEVSNCAGEPDWPVSKAAYDALINLCTDICRRHGFRLNFTGDKSGNLHMHKWYQSTGCPGAYLSSKFPNIAEEVNRRLDGENDGFYRVQCGAFNSYDNAVIFRDGLRAKGYTDAFILKVERN